MYKRIIQKIQPILYRGIKWYYAKPRLLKRRGITIHLLPSVFHPAYYLSTDIFLDYLLTLPIANKKVLELGTGNGFISLYLAKNEKCNLIASDINPQAIKGLELSAKANQVSIQVILSDLFDKIFETDFDYILVNPPYYPKQVSSDDEYAFFCGENFEYFHKFFRQILLHLKTKTSVFVILSETAPCEKIATIAQEYGIAFEEIFTKKKNREYFVIYKLSIS